MNLLWHDHPSFSRSSRVHVLLSFWNLQWRILRESIQCSCSFMSRDVSEDSFMKNGCAIKECGKSYHACVCKCCANCGIEFSNNEPNVCILFLSFISIRNIVIIVAAVITLFVTIVPRMIPSSRLFVRIPTSVNYVQWRSVRSCSNWVMIFDRINLSFKYFLFFLSSSVDDSIDGQIAQRSFFGSESVSLSCSSFEVFSLFFFLMCSDSEGLLEMVQKSVPISHIKVMQVHFFPLSWIS